MSLLLQAIRKELEQLKSTIAVTRTDTPTLDRLRADPANAMKLAGMAPDEWQAKVLRSASTRQLLLCSRQSGKSTVAAALALLCALLDPPALILLLSPTMRQSGELFRKVRETFRDLGGPVPMLAQSVLRMELTNGSRVIALPGIEPNVRCYSGVDLLIVDEAARVPDPLYLSIRPMLAVSKGKLVALSTPYAKRGWFYSAWQSRESWERVRITAGQCPRISSEFLAEERLALGERWYRQEYECSFEDIVDAVFAAEDIHASLSDEVEPLF